jgi:hypothetical protein
VQCDGLGSLYQGLNATSYQAAPSMSAEASQGHGLLGRVASPAVGAYPDYIVEAAAEMAASSLGMSVETFMKYYDAALVTCNQLMEVSSNVNRSFSQHGRLQRHREIAEDRAGQKNASALWAFGALLMSRCLPSCIGTPKHSSCEPM